MSNKPSKTDPFFSKSDLTLEKAKEIVKEGLSGADYGEFYHEMVSRQRLVKDKGEFTAVSPATARKASRSASVRKTAWAIPSPTCS